MGSSLFFVMDRLKNDKGYELEEAIEIAINKCIENDVMTDILFGGYATPRKHIVFSRLALNSYNIFKK